MSNSVLWGYGVQGKQSAFLTCNQQVWGSDGTAHFLIFQQWHWWLKIKFMDRSRIVGDVLQR